jgi:hypothetical protein
MTAETIRGGVDVALLDKADRLFRNDDEGIWIEVLQNARRAGATLIAISIEEASPEADSCTVTVEDNGRGITDFQTLVTLGHSEWTEKTQASEDPAGMGFFSLCHSDVEVHSGYQGVRISRAVFLGKAEAKIEKRNEVVRGTRLRFQRPSTRRALLAALERVTEFLPMEVRLEGNALPRHDFLAGALHRELIDGIEVGFAVHFTFHASSDLNWNFYGARLRHAPMQIDGLLTEKNQVLAVSARFLVLETAAIKLQLPDRKGILEDTAFREFQKKAAAAAYRFFQTQPRHVLSYRNWREAQELEIDLPEAVPLLEPWYAHPQDDGIEPVFDHAGAEVLNSVENVILVSHDLPDAHTLEAALHSGVILDGALYCEKPAFQGYSWYDSLPMITDTAVLVDNVPYEDWCKTERPRPDHIDLVITMEQAGTSQDVRLPAVIHVDSDRYNELQFVAVRNSPWDNDDLEGPFSVEDFLMAATFSSSDDFDADSWNTQEDGYRDEVKQTINEYFRGPRASLRGILRGAITWQASRLADQVGVREIRFKRNGHDWDIELFDSNQTEIPARSIPQPS